MNDSKIQRLRQSGTLNPHPEKVTDPLFADSEFFDPNDLLQVRYEMIRCAERVPLRETAERFGASVPTCVRAKKAFFEGGLQALVPRRRGPRGAHKITAEILAFVAEHRTRHGPVGSRKLVPLIAERFAVKIHPRGLEKAIERAQKKKRLARLSAMVGGRRSRTLLSLALPVASESRNASDRAALSSRPGESLGTYRQFTLAGSAARNPGGTRLASRHAGSRRHDKRLLSL